jgi:hypothetical protein
MGARPGFIVTRRGQHRHGDDITVEVRVFAPAGTNSGKLKALLAEANVESHVEIERIFGFSGGGYAVATSTNEADRG